MRSRRRKRKKDRRNKNQNSLVTPGGFLPEKVKPERNSESIWEDGAGREWESLCIINMLCKSREKRDIAFDLDPGKQSLMVGVQNMREKEEREEFGDVGRDLIMKMLISNTKALVFILKVLWTEYFYFCQPISISFRTHIVIQTKKCR